MNSKLTFLLGLALCCLLAPTALRAQFSIEVTVNGASNLSSLCGDIIGSPDLLWEVNVENTGWVTYPASGGCFTAVPYVQYTSPTYGCVSEVGMR
ncbi:MAG: hypothetical protein KDC44_11415, partial [Phaeodactylibacter sp.]|nr:hypothetical protein [Phaeodactylibacter sp.]